LLHISPLGPPPGDWTLVQANCSTDDDGHYEVALPPGRFRIQADQTSREIDVTGPTVVDLELTP
jgi:hypothetical protein